MKRFITLKSFFTLFFLLIVNTGFSAGLNHSQSAINDQNNWIETFEGSSEDKIVSEVGNFVGIASVWEINGLVRCDSRHIKNGERAVLLKRSEDDNSSRQYMKMIQDKPNGAGIISVFHGTYTENTNGSWRLEVSNNGGETWDAFVQEIQEVPTQRGEYITFNVNIPGNIRIKITNITDFTGMSAITDDTPINIDDIMITDYNLNVDMEISMKDPVKVFSDGQTLYVENLENEGHIYIYDLNGKLLGSYKIDNDNMQVPLCRKGIFLIKITKQKSNKTYKISNR